jgi:cytochrome P450
MASTNANAESACGSIDKIRVQPLDLGKIPVKVGYFKVIIHYRPAAVEQFLVWAHHKYGEVIQYHWKSRVVSVGNYELAALLLKHPNFQRKGIFTETVTILNPLSLVSISGLDWKRAHWLMVRAISRISIQNMCSSVKTAVNKFCGSTELLAGSQVDLYDFAKKVTLDGMIFEVFGAGISESDVQVIHDGIGAIIGELQGLTQSSSHYRTKRQSLDTLVDAKLETEYITLIQSMMPTQKSSVILSSTFPPSCSTSTIDTSPFDSGCSFLSTLMQQNISNNRSPSKASQTPFSLKELRDLVINVLLFMGTINPAEASVHAILEIFRSKWSSLHRDVWIETQELIRHPDSADSQAGFSRILRESLRMFPPVAGLSFNRRATADTVLNGWRFNKDVCLF